MRHMKNSKLIFYVGNFERPQYNATGKRVIGIARILSELGYKVILVGKVRTNDTKDFPIKYSDSIDYYSFPNRGYSTLPYIMFLKRIINRVGKPKIIIRFGSPGLAFFDKMLHIFCKKYGIKMIADVDDWLPADGNSIIFNIIKTIDTYLRNAKYNCQSDGVITITSYLRNYYSRRNCKTIVLPPLVYEYKQNISNNDKVKIVYAGIPFRIGKIVKDSSEAKDRLDICIKALSRISNENVVFEIYGITREQYLVAYPSHKKLLDKSSRSIMFYGKKRMEEVQRAINNADYTIILRDRNRATMAGFSTKVVESLSCGTPVITTDTSDLKKYITEGENGFYVDISNKNSLVTRLEEIVSFDSSRRKELKDNCYGRQDFIYTNYIESMNTFISEIDKKE